MDKKNIHLICNTHWDREWRWSFRETQDKLVTAMDTLIDTMIKDERYTSFLTDSQSSMVEDYLEIRPERTEDVKKLVKDGRLCVGPWYTLPAEYLVSAESLTRNLLIGHNIANKLGKVNKVGYNIFSWGQVSQLPQIYKNFGIDTIFFYRGLDKSKLDNLEFIWQAPDGTKALAVTFGAQHRINFWVYVYKPYLVGDLAPKGFDFKGDGYLFHICDSENADRNQYVENQPCQKDMDKALQGMQKLVDTLKKAATDELLALQGFDLEYPDPIIPDLVQEINKNIEYANIKMSDINTYVEVLKRELVSSGKIKELKCLCTEMLEEERVSPEYGPLYNGVFSSRMPIKLLNVKCENEYYNKAEPLNTMAYFFEDNTNKIYMDKATKLMCANQQHDGIGGCHVDRIARSMIERYEESLDISHTVLRKSLRIIVKQIDFSNLAENEKGIVVTNPTNYPISDEVVRFTVDMNDIAQDKVYGGYLNESHIEIYDMKGEKVPSTTLCAKVQSVFAYRTYGGNDPNKVTRFEVAAKIKHVPPYGFAKFIVKYVPTAQRKVAFVSKDTNTLENAKLCVKINFDGSLSVLDKATGERYEKLNVFVETGEIGGPLIHSKPFENEIFTTQDKTAQITLINNCEQFATYKVVHKMQLPKEKVLEYSRQLPLGNQWIEHGNFKRSKQTVEFVIESLITLKENGDMVEIETTLNNNAKDHKVSAMFASGIKEQFVEVDQPYDVVKREYEFVDSTGWFEGKSVSFPTSTFVHKYSGKRSITLHHLGLHEYEVVNDKEQSLMLTLVRGFESAGGNAETFREEPMAQCQGTLNYKYALSFGKGDYVQENAVQKSNKLQVAPIVIQCTNHTGAIKDSEFSFFDIENKNLHVTAVKIAEDNESVVIRMTNLTERDIESDIKFAFAPKEAYMCDMEEKRLAELQKTGEKTAKLSVKSKQICSINFKF